MSTEKIVCPKCGKKVESLCCDHCGSSLADWQADLYGATVRQIAKLGGNHADADHQGDGAAEVASPTGNGVHGKRFNRPGDDFYPTPPEAVEALLRCEQFDGPIWEPACGDGAISKILIAQGHEVVSSDKVDRGYGDVADFLTAEREVRHIVTNPPYNRAEEFIEHALQCASGKVAMLLRLAFLEGQQRYEKWNRWPLKTVWVFSKRISMYPGKHQTGHGLYPYAWFVWDHAHQGPPEVKWIPPEWMSASPCAQEDATQGDEATLNTNRPDAADGHKDDPEREEKAPSGQDMPKPPVRFMIYFRAHGTTTLEGTTEEEVRQRLDAGWDRLLQFPDDLERLEVVRVEPFVGTANNTEVISAMTTRSHERLLEDLRIWIEDAADAGMTKTDVMDFWDQFSGEGRCELPRYLALLPESYQTMWSSLAA